jgi:hypothetical protein
MVIDGSAFFRSIFNAAHVDLSYGAQYDQYVHTILLPPYLSMNRYRAILLQRLKFFKDNQIQVIVYLDGISDDAKLDTVLTRFQKKITEVHQLVKTIQSNPMGPIQVDNSQIWFPPFIKVLLPSLMRSILFVCYYRAYSYHYWTNSRLNTLSPMVKRIQSLRSTCVRSYYNSRLTNLY